MEPVKLDFRRFEIKYLVLRSIVPELIDELLGQNLVWDPYVADVPERYYTVTSLYFDTPDLLCFYSKVAGVNDRVKLRLRIYGERLDQVPYVFAEVKRRNNAIVTKRRTQLLAERVAESFRGGWGFGSLAEAAVGDRSGLDEFLRLQQTLGMVPMANISYHRTPLVGRFNPGLRVTFDEHILVSTIPDISLQQHLPVILDPYAPVATEFAVMEIKYWNALPHWFSWIIRRYGLERAAVSKYGFGVMSAAKKGHLAYS